jgi:DNA-binding beta-propeller fold protein YncE/mono/diheme cytochrome c family protein
MRIPVSLITGWLICLPAWLWAGSSNSLLDLSPDGQLLICSNRDSYSLSVIARSTGKLLREIPVGRHPEGVSFYGSGHQAAVALHGDDAILLIDCDSGETLHRIEVEDEPYGLATDSTGQRLFATLEFPGKVLEIDPRAGTIVSEWQVGSFLRGIAVGKNGLIHVTEYLTGALKQLDPGTGLVLNTDPATGALLPEWAGTIEDNLARQVALHPVSGKAFIPHQRSRVTIAHGGGSIFPYIATVNTRPEFPADKPRRRRVQMDSFRGTYVVANPWELALSPDGEKLYVVFSGTDDMFVCRVLDDDYRELEFAGLIRLGANPRAVRVSADGSQFYIYNALDLNVVAYDAASLKPLWTTEVTRWPYSDEILLGKKLFYTAKPPLTAQKWISCSSCHPDGDPDGRTWQQPEGLRNTQAMFGIEHTHPIHWSADRDEVQDFEITIRSPLMQGRGLLRGPLNDPLGPPHAGLSAELDALAAYTNSHGILQSPFAKKGLSPAAQRGKALFLSAETKCASCHSGDYLTDRQMHDVGTGTADPTELLGPSYDTPTLHGVYRTAPYLHHGMAATLEDVLTRFNPDDQHGRTSHLTPEQIADLTEYLKALPEEDLPSTAELQRPQQRLPAVSSR